MAFDRKKLSLSVDTIGGGSIRLHFYTTDDSEETVTTAGYFANVARRGVRAGDLIVVYSTAGGQNGGTFLTEVTGVASGTGDASVTINRNFLQEYANVAAVEGARIPSMVVVIRTQGYTFPGDGSGSAYKRVASEPAHSGKIQSADGGWWEEVWSISNMVIDRASAASRYIPAAVVGIRTQAFDASVSSYLGGAHYRESDASEVASYPASAWFTSNGGSRYWLLDDAEISMTSLGARADAMDNAPAINDWLATLKASGRPGYFPAGTFDFKSQVSLATVNNVSIKTAGPRNCVLRYTGAATDIDLVVFGDGLTAIRGWQVDGFRVTSETVMTDGWAVHFKRMVRSHIGRVLAEGQDGAEILGGSRLWNGIFFNSVDIVSCSGFQAYAQGTGVAVAGAIGLNPKADLFLGGGFKIGGGCAVGLHVGGAFGGLHVDAGDVINCGTCLLIDNELVAEANREIIFGPGFYIDTATSGALVHINQSIPSTCWIIFNGSWIATSVSHGVRIQAGSGNRIQFNGGTVFNCSGDGFHIETSSPIVQINGTLVRDNDGWGVYAEVPTGNCRTYATYSGNGLGDMHPNITGNHDFSGRLRPQSVGLDVVNYWHMNGTTPQWVVDSGDYFQYGRGGNAYEWYIANSKIGRMTVNGIFGTAGVGCDGGGWDTGRLYLGSHQFWVDAAGRLRMKTGSNPTSDTDGTIVGTQS